MTFGEQIAEVARKLDDVALKRYRPDQVKRWLNHGNYDVCHKIEPLENIVSANIVNTQADYQLPLDYVSIKQLEYVSGTTVATLLETNWRDMNILRTKTQPTTPTYFLHWAGAVTLSPTPASSITNGLRLYYYYLHPLLSELTDISSFQEGYHDLAILYACHRAKQTDAERGDPDAGGKSTAFEQEYYGRLTQMAAELSTRRMDKIPKFRDITQVRSKTIKVI